LLLDSGWPHGPCIYNIFLKKLLLYRYRLRAK